MKTRRDQMTTYTQEDISNWLTALASIPEQIKSNQKIIDENEKRLNELEPRLNYLIGQEINPTHQKIKTLDAQIKVLTLPEKIENLKQKIAPHQTKLDTLLPELEKVDAILKPIENEIYSLETLIQIRDCQDELDQIHHKIRTAQASLSKETDTKLALTDAVFDAVKDISKIESQIFSLQQTLNVSHYHSSHGHHHHVSHGGYTSGSYPHGHGHQTHEHGILDSLGHVAHTVSDISLTNQINDLQHQLNVLKSQKMGLESQLQAHERNISSLRNEIAKDQSRLDHKNQEMHSLQRALGKYGYTSSSNDLESSLNDAERKKEPYQIKKNELEDEIRSNINSRKQLQQEKNELQVSLDKSKKIVKDLAPNSDLNDLQLKLKEQQEIYNSLDSQQQALVHEINIHTKSIRSQQEGIRTAEAKLRDLNSNEFLHQLTNEPGVLFDQLLKEIPIQFEKYENEHPANQPTPTRLCLAEINEKINFIRDQQLTHLYGLSLVTNDPDQKKYQQLQKYYQLSGFLRHKYKQVVKEDPEFAAAIAAAIGTPSVDADEAINEYNKLKGSYYVLNDWTEQKLFHTEKTQYNNAYNDLNSTLKQLQLHLKNQKCNHTVHQFLHNGEEVLKAIERKVKKAIKAGDTKFQIKFHTTLLNKTTQLLRTPDDPQLRKEYKALTKRNKDGQPSLCKKIFGAMLMFLGSAIFVTSAVMEGLTAGFLSPLAIAGMGAGALITLGGLGLFCHGREKGIAKRVDQFTKSSEQCGMDLSMWNQPPSSQTHLDQEKEPDYHLQTVPSAPPL